MAKIWLLFLVAIFLQNGMLGFGLNRLVVQDSGETPSSETMTFSFPKDRNVGLIIYGYPSPGSDSMILNKRVGILPTRVAAQGDVKIPKSASAELKVNEEGLKDFT